MKGYEMIKKGSILALALLLSLPGCWNKKDKKAATPKKTKEMAQLLPDQSGEEFDIAADDTMESFFSEMDDFRNLDDPEFDMADAGDSDDAMTKKSEFTWAADDDESKKLETVYFEFDNHIIDADQKDKLENNADKAKDLLAEAKADGIDAKIVVSGYGCTAGSEKYNEDKSDKRAKAVSDLLVENGILAEDIEAQGYGKTNLIVENGSREEQWQN